MCWLVLLRLAIMKGKRFLTFIVSLFSLILNAESASRIDPLVDTKAGLVRGVRASDGEYSMFMGVPYAYINESNPFGQSIPHPGFNGTYDAFDDSAICPQISKSGIPIGSLDCLHLNIHVPNTASSANRLPVMVWIHGGAFEMGFSGRERFGPRYLVRHDVILVSINYRLGIYGFMCLDTPEIPGNQGLKDQHLALKWVKSNIEAFGGDVNKITIFGESAGGVSVDLHLFYSENNLFNKVIMQSGTALSPFGILDSDRTVPLKLAEHLGLKTDDLEEALSFLTRVHTKLVIAASAELSIIYRPCVEKHFDNIDNFIHDHPLNLDLPRVKNIPVLAGSNNDESLAWVLSLSPEVRKSLILDYLKQYLIFSDEEVAKVEELLRHFYVGEKEINESSIQSIVDFDSDFIFNHPISRSIQKYLRNGATTIYQYVFSYIGRRNLGKQSINVTIGGAAHGDELGYLFGTMSENDQPTPKDQVVIDRITTLWTNFAKYGNPTPETSELLPVTWPPVVTDTLPYLNIDSEIKIESRPFHARIAFWDLFYKLYYKAQRGYSDEE